MKSQQMIIERCILSCTVAKRHHGRKFLAVVSQVYDGRGLEILCHNAHKSCSPLLSTCRLLTIVLIIFSPRVRWRSSLTSEAVETQLRVMFQQKSVMYLLSIRLRSGNLRMVMMSIPSSRTKTRCKPFIVSTMQRAHHQKTLSFHWPRFASISNLQLHQTLLHHAPIYLPELLEN